jgi:hypothetical protein
MESRTRSAYGDHMDDPTHLRGDWCPETGSPSGGRKRDHRCRACGAPIEPPRPRVEKRGIRSEIEFRSALLTPWLRGHLRLDGDRIVGTIPRSLLCVPIGQRSVDVPLSETGATEVARTRSTLLGSLASAALELPDIGLPLLVIALLPILYAVSPVFTVLGAPAGIVTAVFIVIGLVAAVWLHGWSLTGITDRDIHVSWADRSELRVFARDVAIARQLGTRGAAAPW